MHLISKRAAVALDSDTSQSPFPFSRVAGQLPAATPVAAKGGVKTRWASRPLVIGDKKLVAVRLQQKPFSEPVVLVGVVSGSQASIVWIAADRVLTEKQSRRWVEQSQFSER